MNERHVKLFKNGRNQAVRIPREFELPGEDAIIRKEGQRLIIEASPPRSLLAVLRTLQTLEEDFPPIEDPPGRAGRHLTMRFLLDANIVSDLMRHPRGKIYERISEVGEDDVCTSIVVAAELRYGVTRKKSARLTSQFEAVLSALEVLPLETPVDAVYGVIRADLERNGRPIGANDLLIAAHALALDFTLVTDNAREFSRIDGLRIENWLR